VLDTSDLSECLRYRIAYGEAARLKDMSHYDHAWGRDFIVKTEGQGERIRQEVSKRFPQIDAEIIALAVDDVMAGRGPRW
jgi:hypothetical protein